MTATNDRTSIPDQSRPGTTTAFPVGHQGRNDKCATGAKLRGREDITIATWNVRTLRAAGKVEELLHEMYRYKWSILGLCKMRLKKSGEIPTDGGHRMYFSGKEDKHEQGVGFLVHKDIVKSVIGCRPISSRFMTVRLRASPFNITIIQVYAPTSRYDDSDVDEFYRELQSLVDQIPKQDILVVQGVWNAKVEDAQEDWGEVCGPSCNPETKDRGLKLLDFTTYNNLVLANTLGNHKPSRRWTWHSPDGTHHNQIDYILVKKRFHSGIKTARTRAFPSADVGSNHDMVMMTFQTPLKNSRKPTQPRIRFDLEKLNDPTVMSAFQATIGGRFAPLAMLVNEDADLDSMVTHFNKAVTDTAAELLGKQRRKRKPWVTRDP